MGEGTLDSVERNTFLTRDIAVESLRLLLDRSKDMFIEEARVEAYYELLAEVSPALGQRLVNDLLKRFILLSNDRAQSFAVELLERVYEAFSRDETVFVCATDEDGSDGSEWFLFLLRNAASEHFSVPSSGNFFVRIDRLYANLPYKKNIILIDDFIGSGDKTLRKLKAVEEEYVFSYLESPSVHAASLAGMQRGVDALRNYGSHVFHCVDVPRGISDFGSNLSRQLDSLRMRQLELLFQRGRNYKLGYKRSEALFGIVGHKVPNNVFPIFWENRQLDGSARTTMFHRKPGE